MVIIFKVTTESSYFQADLGCRRQNIVGRSIESPICKSELLNYFNLNKVFFEDLSNYINFKPKNKCPKYEQHFCILRSKYKTGIFESLLGEFRKNIVIILDTCNRSIKLQTGLDSVSWYLKLILNDIDNLLKYYKENEKNLIVARDDLEIKNLEKLSSLMYINQNEIHTNLEVITKLLIQLNKN